MDLVVVAEEIPSPGQTVIGTDFQIHPGGKGANQAVAVARLGYPVQMIGCLGNDAFGEQLRSELDKVGVDTASIATTEGSSGVALIVVSSAGENTITVASGANAKLTTQDLDANIDRIRQAGMVLAQLETPLETIEYLAYLCAREKIPFILDPAPARDLPSTIFKNIAWFTPNQTEAALYTGTDGRTPADPVKTAATILANGCHGVVLKMGSQGAYLASQGAMGELVPAFAVKAIDTTAAGDAFNGGFATGLMLGKSPEESAMFASAVAAISVTRTGAQPSMPKLAEVEEFMKNGSVRRANE
jgi:ribokinase